MRKEIAQAFARRHDPLVIDRSLDVAFFVLWAVYGVWGFTSSVVNTTILDIPFLTLYPVIWGMAIGVFAIIACSAILASLFTASDQFRERILQKRVEAVAVGMMGGLIAVHPILQWLRLFTDDPTRPDTAVLALSYLVMPIFRVHLQLQRAAAVREADQRYKNAQDDGEGPGA